MQKTKRKPVPTSAERRALVKEIHGKYAGLFAGPETRTREKQAEIDREERKFERMTKRQK